jgi:hypothetical protein
MDQLRCQKTSKPLLGSASILRVLYVPGSYGPRRFYESPMYAPDASQNKFAVPGMSAVRRVRPCLASMVIALEMPAPSGSKANAGSRAPESNSAASKPPQLAPPALR